MNSIDKDLNKGRGEYTEQELNASLKEAMQDSGNIENIKNIQEISTELLKRKKDTNTIEFDEDAKAKLIKMASGKASKQEVLEFVTNDLKKHQSKFNAAIEAQNKTIEDLKHRLADKEVTIEPTRKERRSLEVKSLENMNKRMDILKNSKEKHRGYPKNVLVFGIAAVEKRFLGVEAAIKRHVVEANRNEIKDDIVTKLTKTKKRLEVKPEDKPYTRKLKEDIKKAIEDAQKEFYKQLESKIVG